MENISDGHVTSITPFRGGEIMVSKQTSEQTENQLHTNTKNAKAEEQSEPLDRTWP